MFIPSLIIKDLKLRQHFEENGMDYHDIDDECSSDDSEGDQGEDILPNALSHQGETHQSARILSLQRKAVRSEEKQKKDVKKALRQQRAQLRLEQAQAKNEGKSLFLYANNTELLLQLQQCFMEYSNNSAATVPGGRAKDEEPDIVVNHVATVDLKMPTSQQSKNHYVHRAGKKVYHYRTALIAELKPAPSRFLKEEAH